jgi:branched-chain amino acid transport system permease protein
MGLVLVYRANRIINFAQGELGAVAAILTASLIVGPGWPFFAAAGVGLVVALLLGAFTEVVLIRRFAHAPRLILTVATIGIAQIFAFLELGLPRLFSYDVIPQPPVPFHLRWTWRPVVFNGGHILIILVVPLVAAGLGAFFRFTRVGIAVRASAESNDRAALLGIPVKRVSTIVWVIAAGLSGLGVLLRLPIQGVAIGAVLGPSLLLRALAAGVIARMEKLPVAFGAALCIGMLEQAVLYRTGRTLVVDGVLFFLILGALIVQRRGTISRADAIGASSWQATKEIRPIPRELRADPIVRWGLRLLGAIGVVLLVWVPLTMPGSRVNLISIGLIFAMIAVSLALLTGWAGQISLGQMSFAAFGAAVAGTMSQHGYNFVVCLLAAGLTGAFVAILIGIPALRMQGLFLAVTTLAFALATGSFLIKPEFVP